ncbi:MAG: hypothetical protein H6621_08150 [Halobacteriovoraceae bacterium]|nr:hypothetical protein [Halobacteriovoraceae bacterium]
MKLFIATLLTFSALQSFAGQVVTCEMSEIGNPENKISASMDIEKDDYGIAQDSLEGFDFNFSASVENNTLYLYYTINDNNIEDEAGSGSCETSLLNPALVLCEDTIYDYDGNEAFKFVCY